MSLMVHHKTRAAGSSQRTARKNAGDIMAFGEYLPATTQPRLKTRFQRLIPPTPPTSTEMRLWPQALRGISATLDAGLSLREATAENRTRHPPGTGGLTVHGFAAQSRETGNANGNGPEKSSLLRRALHRLTGSRRERAYRQTQDDIDELLDTLAREEQLGFAAGKTLGALKARRAHSRERIRELGLCLRMNETTGAPLAQTLRAAAEHAEEHLDALLGRESALTGPKTTGKILSWLPFIGLVMGWLMGTDPVGALTGSLAGLLTGFLGITLALLGRRWTARLVHRAERSSVLAEEPAQKNARAQGTRRRRREKKPQKEPAGFSGSAEAEPLDPALMLELLAAQLRAGLGLTGALQTLGRALAHEERAISDALEHITLTLTVSADWQAAWDGYDHPLLRELARILAPAYSAGTPSAALLRHCAATYRLEERRAAERASAKLAVALVLPLGLCSLPAFICCGIIPIVISLLPGLLA